MSPEGSTKENIDELTYEEIETIRGKQHKIPNEFSICNYLNVNTRKIQGFHRIPYQMSTRKWKNKKHA